MICFSNILLWNFLYSNSLNADFVLHNLYLRSFCFLNFLFSSSFYISLLQMNVVVHKYLMGVRKVQRNIRDFIACKHAKIVSLSVLWTRIERNYVKHMVEKRKVTVFALVFTYCVLLFSCRGCAVGPSDLRVASILTWTNLFSHHCYSCKSAPQAR